MIVPPEQYVAAAVAAARQAVEQLRARRARGPVLAMAEMELRAIERDAALFAKGEASLGQVVYPARQLARVADLDRIPE